VPSVSAHEPAASGPGRVAVPEPADTAAGVALIAGSAVAYSSAGFFTRLIDVDLWTLIFWRGLFSTLFLLAISYALRRGGTIGLFRSLDAAGWLAAGFSTAAMFCYLAALRNTTVADVAIIYGTAPFVTAAIALLLLGEHATRLTLLCSALALTGVILMVGGSNFPSGLGGDVLALGMTIFMALMIISTRRSRGAPALPIAALSSLASSILAAPLAQITSPDGQQIAELALFGVSQLGLGLLLLTAGSRRLSASRVALIGGLDVPLAPIWVWLAFGETPTTATVAGGLAVIAAVVLNTLLSNRQRHPTPTPAGVAPGDDYI
jgi:drug/metabolite transporter (DMT)-like permease